MKRGSVLPCSAPDGSWLKSRLILPRKMIGKDLFEHAIKEESAKLLYQEPGSPTTILFQEWRCKAFLPELQQ
jgi:hypothetical protein